MDIGVISVRYARALLKSANAGGTAEQVYQEMGTVARSFLEVPQLQRTIDSPMLSRQQKESLIVTAAGGNPSELTKAFVQLVVKEGREQAMIFMAHSFITLYRQQKNIIRGKLTTAARVSAQTVQKMQGLVEERTNGNVEFETEVNPDLIGGFILEYDTFRLDASVKTKLQNILTQLSK